MPHKIAGIDVHKKVLMGVVIDASTPEEKPARRRLATLPSELGRLSIWLRGAGCGRSGDGILGAIVAIGRVGVGAICLLNHQCGATQSVTIRASVPCVVRLSRKRRRAGGANTLARNAQPL
jgi:hypothetical protein